MESWKLLLLALVTIAGAMATAKYEASQYALQRKLSHVLLTLTRIAFGLLIIRLVLNPETPWHYLFPLLLLAGMFAPSHRILLWWFRTHRYKQRIPFVHLGKGWYDTLWMTLSRGNMTLAYCLMTALELTVAVASYGQVVP